MLKSWDHKPCDDWVLQVAREISATVAAARAAGRDPLEVVEMNFAFVGPPGVGKTTVARRFGRLFVGLGLLGTEKVLERCGDPVAAVAQKRQFQNSTTFKRSLSASDSNRSLIRNAGRRPIC